jgi:membrane-associated phospholipid phosphatase
MTCAFLALAVALNVAEPADQLAPILLASSARISEAPRSDTPVAITDATDDAAASDAVGGDPVSNDAAAVDAPAVDADADDAAATPAPQDTEEKKPPTPVHTGFKALFYGLGQDFKHLPSKTNMYIALGGGAASLAVHPIDDDVNDALKSHYDIVNNIYKPAHVVGETWFMVGASLVTYGVGRIAHKPKAAHFGMDLLRADIIDTVLVTGLKYATHRERPNHADNLSFPSGHASITFATATVIERHLGWKMAALGYAFAAYVASSRLHDNVHWLSDVVFGSTVGVISGRTVTEHGRNFWSVAPVPVPGGGVAIMATRIAGGERR